MKVTIEYCMQWNYTPQASSLGAAIKKRFGVDSQLIPGAGGIFDVHADGTRVWCKKEVGRFPENDEVIKKIEALTAKK